MPVARCPVRRHPRLIRHRRNATNPPWRCPDSFPSRQAVQVSARPSNSWDWLAPALALLILGGFAAAQALPEDERQPDFRPETVDLIAHLAPGAEAESVSLDVFDPESDDARDLIAAGFRGISVDYEGHRLCVYVSEGATSDEASALRDRLEETPGVVRVEGPLTAGPTVCGGASLRADAASTAGHRAP